MASVKPTSRYTSFDARSSKSSQFSDPSCSAELKNPTKAQSSFKRLIGVGGSRTGNRLNLPDFGSSQKENVKQSSIVKVKNEQNLSAMVKKFVETRSGSKPKAVKAVNRTGLVIPADFIAADLKRTARKGTNFTALHRKLFSKGSGSGSSGGESSGKKALTEMKANTRTLAMVLRSERELLSQNKMQDEEISELKSMLEHKNNEIEKLKDLCLKQRTEIKSLKSAVLFPEETNSQLQELLEKQGTELKQTKQIIPSLQKQVCSLTGQLQCLAVDLAEVKADKSLSRGCLDDDVSSPKTPPYDREVANSLEYSSGDFTTPGSPDDMLLKDLNPCLTPYPLKTKLKEFEETTHHSLHDGLSDIGYHIDNRFGLDHHSKNASRSSDSRPKKAPHRSNDYRNAF